METISKDNITSLEKMDRPPPRLPPVLSPLLPFNRTPAEAKKGFLDLPPELRNIIYSHLLGDGLRMLIALDRSQSGRQRQHQHHSKSILHPSILSTCKSIRKETRPILYGANTFIFHFPDHIMNFSDSIGDNRNHLRHITLCLLKSPSEFNPAMNDYVAKMSSLVKMEFTASTVWPLTAENMAERLALPAWEMWKNRRGNTSNTMNSVVDIFRFGEYEWIKHSRWCYSGASRGNHRSCELCGKKYLNSDRESRELSDDKMKRKMDSGNARVKTLLVAGLKARQDRET